jgi:Outer membrane protein beta-barrel domain
MKRILLVCLAVCLFSAGFAQDEKKETNDTIRIGGMIIVKKAGSNEREIIRNDKTVRIPSRKYKNQNVTTNWWIVDLGYSAFNDKTDYTSAAAQSFAPGINEDWFDMRAGKSRNVNIWFFMQRLNMIEHVVNLKYGMGLELNNYFFDDERVRFAKNPTQISLDNSLKDSRKNKLAVDYLTVPIMLNFNFTPNRRNGFGLSGGISAGYLYSARQKTKINSDKDKLRNDFDLKRWKLSYIGELNLGPVKLYGSYAFENMWDKGLDMTPYTVGFRMSNW